jgi:hypothetical protein
MWDPWEATSDLTVVEGPCPVPGVYFPDHHAIVLAAGQSASMRRSVLAEELGHHELGHLPVTNPVELARMEFRARRWAAHRLIDFGDLLGAVVGACSIDEAAELLEVDSDLVRLRVSLLSDEELRMLEEVGG